ncbi:MAG TPA: carbonic anhydrase [Opitutae bacterium]|nr:carbonic anhydrase [Opitutae bacterium]
MAYTGKQNPSIAKLLEGYAQFKSAYIDSEHSKLKHLAEQGQSPKTMFICCCDSRVDPALLFGVEPGDIFVVRNVANLVPPYISDRTHHGTSAALEFAVCGLGVSEIVVLGHGQCGGIQALMTSEQNSDDDSFINAWMRIAAPAKEETLLMASDKSQQEQFTCCEKAALRISLGNLSSFPWIASRVKEGSLSLHAWYFDLNKRELQAYDDTNAWVTL